MSSESQRAPSAADSFTAEALLTISRSKTVSEAKPAANLATSGDSQDAGETSAKRAISTTNSSVSSQVSSVSTRTNASSASPAVNHGPSLSPSVPVVNAAASPIHPACALLNSQTVRDIQLYNMILNNSQSFDFTGQSNLTADANSGAALLLSQGLPMQSNLLSQFVPTAASVPSAVESSVLPVAQQSRRSSLASQPDETAESLVRKQEIAKALKSKPQRGRKRCNLSDVERMELTRTRNREHAKSTRVRKKARHQELLDTEAKYRDLVQVEVQNKARRQLVEAFLHVLHQMFRQEEVEIGEILDRDFVFDDGSRSTTDCGLDRLKQFRKRIKDLLVNRVGSGVRQGLSCSLRGGVEAVALAPNDSAMAEFEIAHDDSVLMRGFAKMKIDTKIRSMFLTITEDVVNEALDAQVSHPSVISLDRCDPSRFVAEGNQEASSSKVDGPGMNYTD